MAYNKQPSAPPQAPPIQYLPAFVAAAQLGSFRAAAQQLNVTPSAISQQIKSLEQRIGLSLFSRQGKELQLSQAGEEFFSFLQLTAWGIISRAGRGLQSDFCPLRFESA